MMGIYNNIIWHATSEHEKLDIKNIMGKTVDIRFAPIMSNIPKINLSHMFLLRRMVKDHCDNYDYL